MSIWFAFLLPGLLIEYFSITNFVRTYIVDKKGIEISASLENKNVSVITSSDGGTSYSYDITYSYNVDEKRFWDTRAVDSEYYGTLEIGDNLSVKYLESAPNDHIVPNDDLYFIYYIMIPFWIPFTLVWFFMVYFGFKEFRKIRFLIRHWIEYRAEITSISHSNITRNGDILLNINIKIYEKEALLKDISSHITNKYQVGDDILVLYNPQDYSEAIYLDAHRG